MDLLIRYSGRVGGMGRPDSVVGVANRFHATPCKTAFGNSRKNFQTDPTVGSIVMELLIRYGDRVRGTGRPDSVVGVANRFKATPCKTTFGNSCKTILERSNGRIYSYGPFHPVLWSGRGYGPTGQRRRAVPIARYSM